LKYWNRFRDLRELFQRPLATTFAKSKIPMSAMAMKLKMLGETKLDAKPWILILCDRSVAKLVRDFFKQPWVKQELNGENGEGDFDFQLHVVIFERPPTLSHCTAGLSAFSLSTPPAWLENSHTFCGRPVMIRDKNDFSVSTIGGLLKVWMPDGNHSLYAMTCGHILSSHLSRTQTESEEGDYSKGDDDIFPNDSDTVYELDLGEYEIRENSIWPDPDETFTINASALLPHQMHISEPKIPENIPPSKEAVETEVQLAVASATIAWADKERLGHVVASSFDLEDENTALDWMLLGVAKNRYLPNAMSNRWKGDLLPSISTPASICEKAAVFAVTSLRGKVNGYLSFNPCSFMVPHGRGWIEAFEFTSANPRGGRFS
jgi:hypothetical protein